MMMLLLVNLFLSFMFMTLNHPLALGGILLALTINTSLMSGFMYTNFWFSYILFLIMVGGMLVMFIYMTSIASNEKFKMPKLIWVILYSSFLPSLLTIIILDSFFSLFNSSELTLLSQDFIYLLNSQTKIFNSPHIQLPIALMSYLLLTLIMVVKMTEMNQGPLRQK